MVMKTLLQGLSSVKINFHSLSLHPLLIFLLLFYSLFPIIFLNDRYLTLLLAIGQEEKEESVIIKKSP